MKHSITLTTYSHETGESLISQALGFPKALSHGAVIDIFASGFRHKNGVFASKKSAVAVAERINQRGAFGGFGLSRVIARVA